MTVTVLTEAKHPATFLISEGEGDISREAIIVAASQTILVGTVLGKTVVAANASASAAADAGNTGSSGAMTLDATTPVLAGAKPGKYRVVCIEPGTNAGTFAVFDPGGVEIGNYVVGGSAFATQIKFTIADATDFVSGDAFSVTVVIDSIGGEQFKALNVSATDGTQIAAGIAIYPATTGVSETANIAMIARLAEVRLSDLAWPAGITTAQKTTALEQLRALNIVGR